MRRRKLNLGRALRVDVEPLDLVRFLSKVKVDEKGCWVWQGHTDAKGYGQFFWSGVPRWAHRFAYAVFVRSVPDGCDVDHACFNRRCVNPKHLRSASRSVNSSRRPALPAGEIPF